MTNLLVQPPLSNVQVELLKLFTTEIPEADLLELKKIMAKFLLYKGRDKADLVWDEKGYSDDKLNKLIGNE